MNPQSSRDLPSSAFDPAKPESRDLAIWAADAAADAAPRAARLQRFLPHALVGAGLLICGVAFANFATAPALTDGVDEISAIDARQMGLALNLDATGAQARTVSISKDVGALKAEIARLRRALDQSKNSQASLSKSAAGQAAANLDEVRGLKTQIASLTKTLEDTRAAATSKIDALASKVDQSKDDQARLAELRDRLDKMEKAAAEKTAEVEKPARAEPETTGSVSAPAAPERVVRNWVVRDVYDGVALLESRGGDQIEVERGARAPGAGRVRSIQRRDGAWVVVTDRGVILPR